MVVEVKKNYEDFQTIWGKNKRGMRFVILWKDVKVIEKILEDKQM